MNIQAKLILWLASLAAVGAVLFGAYQYGRYVEGLARDSEQLGEVKDGIQSSNQLAKKDSAASLESAKHETARQVAEAKRTSRVEQSIAAHPEYQTCALSPADLAELNNATGGK